jgi:hypothetical protein
VGTWPSSGRGDGGAGRFRIRGRDNTRNPTHNWGSSPLGRGFEIVSGIDAKFVRTDHQVGTLKLRCNYCQKVNMRGVCPIVRLLLFGMCSLKAGA